MTQTGTCHGPTTIHARNCRSWECRPSRGKPARLRSARGGNAPPPPHASPLRQVALAAECPGRYAASSPIGDPIPLLVEALADDDVDMRLLAIDLLDELEPDERSLPALIGALGDDEPLVRIWAASRVVRFGPRAKAAISALEKWLTPDESMPPHRQEWFRLTAADALVRIDPSRLDILPLLIAALDSHNPLCQLVAAEALGDIGGRAAAVALPKLEELLLAEPDNVWFAEAIEKIDAETASDSSTVMPPWDLISPVEWKTGAAMTACPGSSTLGPQGTPFAVNADISSESSTGFPAAT